MLGCRYQRRQPTTSSPNHPPVNGFVTPVLSLSYGHRPGKPVPIEMYCLEAALSYFNRLSAQKSRTSLTCL